MMAPRSLVEPVVFSHRMPFGVAAKYLETLQWSQCSTGAPPSAVRKNSLIPTFGVVLSSTILNGIQDAEAASSLGRRKRCSATQRKAAA
jgi:hypothetical protein